MVLLSPRRSAGKTESGAALVLVLSLMALMAVVCVAFLISASKQVSISNQSSAIVQTSEAAQMALGLLVEDLRSEMQAGSVIPDSTRVVPASATNVLYPASPQTAVPDRSSASPTGVTSAPNLLKQSAYGRKFFDDTQSTFFPRADKYPATSRATELSTWEPSAPESSITSEKWNRPLLLPREKLESTTDFTPATSGASRVAGADAPWRWTAPNWVYLQKSGKTDAFISAALAKARLNGADPVIARFAYQIYDEGGLLDLNVAGYDSKQTTSAGAADYVAARKGSLGYAQLKELGFTAEQITSLVGVRNPGTMKAADSPPYLDRYANFVLIGRNNLGFLRPGGNAETGMPLPNAAIPSRLALQDLLQKLAKSDTEKAAMLEKMQYLTHFSRGLEQPSYRPGFYDPSTDPNAASFTFPRIVPPASGASDGNPTDDTVYKVIDQNPGIQVGVTPTGINMWDSRRQISGKMPWEMAISNNRGGNDAWGKVSEKDLSRTEDKNRYYQDIVNPGFLEVRVPITLTRDTAPLRNDGTPFVPGEPLVKKRFPLERLAWLTSKGPSALQPPADYSFNKDGTAENILKSFGLVWTLDPNTGAEFWAYNVHNRPADDTDRRSYKFNPDRGDIIYTLEEVARLTPIREPNFFEVLKASIAVGSLGKSAVADHWSGSGGIFEDEVYHHLRDRRVDFQVFDIGVNLVDQYDSDSFPTVLKVPNLRTDFGSAAPGVSLEPFSPPLYIARGVENLPYFYRFHWRAVEDTDSGRRPNPSSGYEVPLDVTEHLDQLNGFMGGYTAVLGLPELWNPHAQPVSSTADPNLVPTDFRVVAVSAQPESMVHSFLWPMIRAGSGPNLKRINANFLAVTDPFGTRPNGRLILRPDLSAAGVTSNVNVNFDSVFLGGVSMSGLWLYWGPDFGTASSNNGQPFLFNSDNMTFQWPFLAAADKINMAAAGQDAKPNQKQHNAVVAAKSLFWNYVPGYSANNSVVVNKPLNGGVPTLGVGLLPMSRAPLGVTMAPVQAVPADPLQVSRQAPIYGGQTVVSALAVDGKRHYPILPLKPASGATAQFYPYPEDEYGGIPAQYFSTPTDWSKNAYGVPTKSAYEGADPPRYPYFPDTNKIFPSGNFTIDHLGSNPDPSYTNTDWIHPWQPFTFALSDTEEPSLARNVFRSAPQLITPPSVVSGFQDPAYGVAGGSSKNRVRDERGSELLFSVKDPNLFRDPIVLCRQSLPAGTGLRAGAANFLAQKLGGSVKSLTAGDWVGFSMGEVPAQTLVMSKVMVYNVGATALDDTMPVTQAVKAGMSGRDKVTIPADLITDLQGRAMKTWEGWWENEAPPTGTGGGLPLTAQGLLGVTWGTPQIAGFNQTAQLVGSGSWATLQLPNAFTQNSGWETSASAGYGGLLRGEFPSLVKPSFYNGYLTGAKVPSGGAAGGVTGGKNVNPINILEAPFAWNGLGYPPAVGVPSTTTDAWIPGYRVRYHVIPTNAVQLGNFRFTIRLQCRDRNNRWVTYDERLVSFAEDGNTEGMQSMVPVLGKPQVVIKSTPVAAIPPPNNGLSANGMETVGGPRYPASDYSGRGWAYGDPKVNPNTPNLWGSPLITAYDPRTSRWGTPGRSALNREGVIIGSANYRDPASPSLSEATGVNPGGSGKTNRPLISGSAVPWDGNIVSCSKGVPAAFMRGITMGMSINIYETWRGLVGLRPPTPLPYFNAGAEYGAGLGLVGYPTLNANDMGWFPRYTDLTDYVSKSSLQTNSGMQQGIWVAATLGANLPQFRNEMRQVISAADFNMIQANTVAGRDWRSGGFDKSFTPMPPIADSLRPSSFMENVAPTKEDPYRQCYADPDDVIRRASGAFAGEGGYGTTGDGLPEVQKTDGSNKPVVLNRPFRSVAEMGYAFRGTPWKNLSFFCPESPDGGLLDAFCLSEPPPVARRDWKTGRDGDKLIGRPSEPELPLVAGKVSLNTRQLPVLKAVIAGVLKDERDKSLGGVVSDKEVEAAALALLDRTTGVDEWLGPLTNVSELAGKVFARDSKATLPTNGSVYTSTIPRTPDVPRGEVRNAQMDPNKNDLSWHFTGYSGDLTGVFNSAKDKKNQRMRESIIRALADAGQTRVWNLMVDVIVQTGRLPSAGRALKDFVKEGEARAWLHLAMDRLTGEILDTQLEWVPE